MWFKVPEFKNIARFQFAQRDRCVDKVALFPDLVILKENDLLITAKGACHRLGISVLSAVSIMQFGKIYMTTVAKVTPTDKPVSTNTCLPLNSRRSRARDSHRSLLTEKMKTATRLSPKTLTGT